MAGFVADHASLAACMRRSRLIVLAYISKLPPQVHRNDLESVAMLGFAQALKSFDPERGELDAYVACRVHGAIKEELRELDYMSRFYRHRIKGIEAATITLYQQLGREATTAEIATELGLTPEDIEECLLYSYRTPLPLEGVFYDENGLPKSRQEPPDSAPQPEEILLRRELIGYLHAAISGLPERYRHIIMAYYFQEQGMKQIAADLEVTDTRISQLMKEARDLLRVAIGQQLGHCVDFPLHERERKSITARREALLDAAAGKDGLRGLAERLRYTGAKADLQQPSPPLPLMLILTTLLKKV